VTVKRLKGLLALAPMIRTEKNVPGKCSHMWIKAQSQKISCSVAFACFLIVGCDSGAVTDEAISSPAATSTPVESILISPVNVMSDFVQRAFLSDQSVESENRLLNGSFENSTDAWTACDTGTIQETNDAYDGTNALAVEGGNCFYQSVQANPGEDIVLSCFSKVPGVLEWTGMGLGFSDENWQVISETPATLVTGKTYARYDVRATVPDNAGFATMWFYSGTDAIVDNCTLLPADQAPVPPLTLDTNLLINPEFDLVESGKPSNWQHFCEGNVVAGDRNHDLFVAITEGACFSQSLNASALTAIQGKEYVLCRLLQ